MKIFVLTALLGFALGVAPAKQVVFLLDASGSMKSQWPAPAQQVVRAVNELKPDQKFRVIADTNAGPVTWMKVWANGDEAGKKKAGEFIQAVKVEGRGDAAASIKEACKFKPEVIWYVSDGEFADNEAVLGALREANQDKKIRVNTVAHYAKQMDHLEMLKRIAQENGGVCLGKNGKPIKPDEEQPTKPVNPADDGPSILQEP